MKTIPFVTLISIAIALPATASAGTWLAGAGRVDITPKEPVWLSGYAARKEPSKRVASPIHVKAFALRDASGEHLVCITCDLLTLPRTLAEPVAAKISATFGISRARILLTASHSHSAPVIRDALIGMYDISKKRIAQVDRYTQLVESALFEAARQALSSLRPAKVSVGSDSAGFARNRRMRTPKDPVDHDVPVLLIEIPEIDDHAAERIVHFAYACHNTTLSGPDICGDYAGFAQEDLESQHGDLTAMFSAGCAGDQNPLPRRTMELARKYGRELADAVTRALSSKLRQLPPASRAAIGWTNLSLEKAPTREQIEEQLQDSNFYRRRLAQSLLRRLEAEGHIAESYPYVSQVWRLGEDHFVASLAGEVVVEYALRLKTEILEATTGTGSATILAYANDCPGYIPSEKILSEGGYEGGDSMVYYGLHSPWSTGVEQRVVDHVLELAREVQNRPSPMRSKNATLMALWSGGSFNEGPTFGTDGALYFTDIPRNRILRYKDANIAEYRNPSGKANGLTIDRHGRLLACEGAAGGNRRVTRSGRDGEIEVLAERFDGKRLNSPNDLTIDQLGRIYFSDPRYGGDEPRELDHESVYRISDRGVELAVRDVVKPNGLAVSADGRRLLVSDSGASKLYSYVIEDSLPLEREGLIFDFLGGRGIDGMEVDQQGNIYGAAGKGELSGIYIISPRGRLLDFIRLPEPPTNCCFGGDGHDLYMTTTTSLFKMRVRHRGIGF